MRQHKLLYASSYDRGLQHLLDLWPKVIDKYPDAELHIFYGWDLFNKGFADNPERLAWRDRMNKKMEQKGITHHGRVSKDELKNWEKECGIWAYPTHFGETNCITALDCQAQGCVPCVINYAGLKETVGSGIRIEGDIYEENVRDEYLRSLLNLMGDKVLWEREQKNGQKFSKDYSWNVIATRWVEEFL